MKELSVKEVTEALKVSETTVRRMIKRGDLPNARRQDRKFWIPQSDVDTYLQQQQEAPGQETKAKPKPKPKVKPKAKPEPEAAPLAEAEVKGEPTPSEPEAAPPLVEVPEPEPKPQEPEPPFSGPEAGPIPVETVPVEETEPTPPPTSEAESPVIEPEWADPLQHQKEIIKEYLVNAGIKSLGWLEQTFKKIRAQIEQYKDDLSKKDDSGKKTDE